jgi:hypothetical protein
LPLFVELGHLSTAGTDPRLGITIVTLGSGPGDVMIETAPAQRPLARLPGRRAPAAWVSIVGRLSSDQLRVAGGARARVEQLCATGRSSVSGTVSVTGVALSDPSRIVVPCGGLRAAPSLALARAVSRSSGPPAAVRASARIAPSVPVGADGRRGVAAGLLGAGIGMLVLATVARRRLDGATPPPVGHPAPVTNDDVPGGAPRLTLVSVPREHGP